MGRLNEKEFGVALDKRIVPSLTGEAWWDCEGGYRVEGKGKDRYLVSAYELGFESRWRTVNLLEERSLVPDFVAAYRRGLERSKPGSLDLGEFERPILDFAGKYGVGINGTLRWAGGPDETVSAYVGVMGVVEPVVGLIEALLSGEEDAIRAALESCPTTEALDFALGESPVPLEEVGLEHSGGLREQALARVGYIVARSFHELCFPFAIPQTGARRLDQLDTGWGFSSLGGAIFWHLYQVLSAQSRVTRCEFCGNLILSAQKNTRFCNGSCRNKHDYHSGNRAKRQRRKWNAS